MIQLSYKNKGKLMVQPECGKFSDVKCWGTQMRNLICIPDLGRFLGGSEI